MRDINVVDIPFGLFLAGIVSLASVAVGLIIAVVILGNSFSEAMDVVMIAPCIALVGGMLVLARIHPGPGRVVERPLLAVAAFLALPMLAVVLTALGVFQWAVAWHFPILFYGLLPSAGIGFAVLFSIVSEARSTHAPRGDWRLVRPASSQGGLQAIPRGEVKVFAGLERGGPEEERPDTYVRMKTRE